MAEPDLFSDEDVMAPQVLSDEDVMKPEDVARLPTAPPEVRRAYIAKQAAEFHQAPGWVAAMPALQRYIGAKLVTYPADIVEGLADFFTKGQKAQTEGLSLEEEVEEGVNFFLMTMGLGGAPFKLPPTKAPIAARQFHEQVVKPAVQEAITPPVTPEPPRQITVPFDSSDPKAQFPPPGVPRSQLALTGDPAVDKIVNGARVSLDNAVVDRTNPVEGQVQTWQGVTYIDRTLPQAVEADGKVYDPADPLIVRDIVGDRTARVLRDGGMSEEAANRMAAFNGDKAEGAWYAAHGIEKPPTEIEKPSDAEIARAGNIVMRSQIEPEEMPPVVVNPLVEAHDLGVIGGGADPAPIPEDVADSPAVAAQRAVPATMKQSDITATPAGEPIAEWETRFNSQLEQLKTPEDIQNFISSAASENSNFAGDHGGLVNPAHLEILADAAGLDPAKVDRAHFAKTLDTNAKVRVAKQALDQTLSLFKEAAAEVEKDPTPENLSKMLEAQIRRDYFLEHLLGQKAEWPENTLKDFIAAREGPPKEFVRDPETQEMVPKKPPEIPATFEDLLGAIDEFMENVKRC